MFGLLNISTSLLSLNPNDIIQHDNSLIVIFVFNTCFRLTSSEKITYTNPFNVIQDITVTAYNFLLLHSSTLFSDSTSTQPPFSVYHDRPLALTNRLFGVLITFFDFTMATSLARAANIAARDHLPLMETYHHHIDLPWINTTPIILHSHVTEISHIGKKFYKEQHLLNLYNKLPRKHRKWYPFSFETLWHWLRQLILRKSNFDLNLTPITESLIRRRWLDKYKYSFFAFLLFYHVMDWVLIPINYIFTNISNIIDYHFSFGVWVLFYCRGLLYFFLFLFRLNWSRDLLSSFIFLLGWPIRSVYRIGPY
jgi:hypothetical protein